MSRSIAVGMRSEVEVRSQLSALQAQYVVLKMERLYLGNRPPEAYGIEGNMVDLITELDRMEQAIWWLEWVLGERE